MNPFVLIDIAGALALCITYMLIEIKYVQLLFKKKKVTLFVSSLWEIAFLHERNDLIKRCILYEWDCNSMNILFFERYIVQMRSVCVIFCKCI